VKDEITDEDYERMMEEKFTQDFYARLGIKWEPSQPWPEASMTDQEYKDAFQKIDHSTSRIVEFDHCDECGRFDPETCHCEAFRHKAPIIFVSWNDVHTSPCPGDNGLHFIERTE